jgi:hypothetical protein
VRVVIAGVPEFCYNFVCAASLQVHMGTMVKWYHSTLWKCGHGFDPH